MVFFEDTEQKSLTPTEEFIENLPEGYENIFSGESQQLEEPEPAPSLSPEQEEEIREEVASELGNLINEEIQGDKTREYLAQLPPNVGRTEVFSPDYLAAFIDSQNVQLLPEVSLEDIVVSEGEGEAAIEEYLGRVAATHNPELSTISSDQVDVATATQMTGDSTEVDKLAEQLDGNIAILKAVPVPVEVNDLHTKMLGATRALKDNLLAFKENIQADVVAALIASRNLDSLDAVWQEIGAAIEDLEKKYGLE